MCADWLLQSYKTQVSPLQGQHICNFSPTCSQGERREERRERRVFPAPYSLLPTPYSIFYRQSIEKYGFIAGTLIGSDRLQRCNSGAWSYLDKYYTGIDQERIYNPPEQYYEEKSKIKYQISKLNNPVTEPTTGAKRSVESNQQLKIDLDFADYLFENNAYVRAISEYKRIFFLTPDSLTDTRIYCRLMLGESYLNMNDYNQALTYFNLGNTALYQYGRARTFFKSGKYWQSRNDLTTLADDDLHKEKIVLIGASYLKQGDFKAGKDYLNAHRYLNDNSIARLSEFDGRQIPRRSRALSTILSAIIPGSGQVYSNRFGDGLYSFITVTSCALISNYYWKNDEKKIKFSIFTLLTAFFYAGNIYGANIAARDYNRYHYNKYQQQIDHILQEMRFMPDYQYLKKRF